MSTSLLERSSAPGLDRDSLEAAATRFIVALARDAQVRERYLAAGHDEPAVAALIAETTGFAVGTDDLPAIAQYLVGNEQSQLEELGRAYPAMNFIVVTTR